MEYLSADATQQLKAMAWLPSDYTRWLIERGWGEIGADAFMLYSGPIQLTELQPDAPSELWAFGDDFAGCIGCFFEDGDGRVLVWDSETASFDRTHLTFEEFIGKLEP